jgi:hypothetical protein
MIVIHIFARLLLAKLWMERLAGEILGLETFGS